MEIFLIERKDRRDEDVRKNSFTSNDLTQERDRQPKTTQIRHLYHRILGFARSDIRRCRECTWSMAVQVGWKAHSFAVEFHMLPE